MKMKASEKIKIKIF